MITIHRNNMINKFTTDMPTVATVESGECVHFECNDCFSQQVQSSEDIVATLNPDSLNPATGPIHIQGAEPGDILKVDILDIQVHNQGSMAIVEGAGFLDEETTQSMTKIIPVRDGLVHFNDLRIPIRPMIGVIGVAPRPEDGEWTTDTPWKHGGNMDTTEITKGTTLYFPVGVEGAKLALGDCHAIMGDGEICITGLEIPADVYLRVTVIKDKPLIWPLLQTSEATYIIGSGKTIDEATKASMSESVKLLSQALNYPWEEAYMLGSLVINGQISQCVNPMKTVRAEIPQSIATTEQIIAALN